MSSHYLISIPEPCHQSWEGMTPLEKGRFCTSCQKQVFDFSTASDEEIIHTIETGTGKLCGRLQVNQMNRILSPPRPVRQSHFFLKAAAGFLLAALFREPVKASATGPEVAQLQYNPAENEKEYGVEPELKDTLRNKIHGIVKDAGNNEPIPFCTVVVKGTHLGVMTDMDGKFVILLTDSLKEKDIVLETSYIGYEPKEFKLSAADRGRKDETVLLTPTHQVLGGAVVVIRPSFWSYVKHPFSRKRRYGIQS
jgi:hypothetical protein